MNMNYEVDYQKIRLLDCSLFEDEVDDEVIAIVDDDDEVHDELFSVTYIK